MKLPRENKSPREPSARNTVYKLIKSASLMIIFFNSDSMPAHAFWRKRARQARVVPRTYTYPKGTIFQKSSGMLKFVPHACLSRFFPASAVPLDINGIPAIKLGELG